jgi:hypothetical protein
MNLEDLVNERDIEGVYRWIDDLVAVAKAAAVQEHFAEVARVCGPEPKTLRDRIAQAINATSSENGSNTPDFILAEYLINCLNAFDVAVNRRAEWYGVQEAQ